MLDTRRCLGLRIWAKGLERGVAALAAAAAAGQAGFACFLNAHMVAESRRDPTLARALRQATWVFPDGRPVARLLHAGQVAGPDATAALLARLAGDGLPVFLFGGTPEMLAILRRELPLRHPGLVIAGTHAPPFRPQSDREMAADAALVRASGAKVCLVALGCPKQERWMHRHATAAGCVLLGVGAAFPILAGITPRAPRLIRRLGLEWLHRWRQEPRRLAHRYTVMNLRFLAAVWRELRTRRR